MAAPTLYRASDTSAPVLTGTAGDLINLLDKCLVNGYGAKSAAGWTRNTGFAGNTTTRAVFRMGAGNQFYLDVDDRGATSALTSASGKEAAVRGYETMTDVGTGTNAFPTTGQVAAATANWRKSNTADTVPRGWFLIADDRAFILGILDTDIANTYKLYYFGDFYSIKSGDGYRVIITVRTVVNSTGATGSFLNTALGSNQTSQQTGHYTPRISAGSGTSALAGVAGIGTTMDTIPTFPALDNNLYLGRLLITNATEWLRGWLRGVYQVLQPVGLNDGDTFTGTGDFTGRSFVVIKGFQSQTATALALETTAWDTSS